MTITVLSIVFTDLRIVVGVVFWAEFVMVVAVLGGNLSINLRELCGAYLGLLIAIQSLYFGQDTVAKLSPAILYLDHGQIWRHIRIAQAVT